MFEVSILAYVKIIAYYESVTSQKEVVFPYK